MLEIKVLLRNPTFCDFPGGGGPNPLPPLLWIRARAYDMSTKVTLFILNDFPMHVDRISMELSILYFTESSEL